MIIYIYYFVDRYICIYITLNTYPTCSMYGIFAYIWAMFRVNVGKYSSTMEHLGAINAGFSGLVSHHVASLGCNNQLGLFLNGTVGGAPVR